MIWCFEDSAGDLKHQWKNSKKGFQLGWDEVTVTIHIRLIRLFTELGVLWIEEAAVIRTQVPLLKEAFY